MGLLASAFSVCAGLAAPPKKPVQAKTSGAFSDISLSRETGDVGGTTLFFFNNGDADYVIIIKAEGEMKSPQISRTQIDGNNVQFVTQGLDKNLNPAMVQFRGTFSSGKLSGRFSNGASLDLPRKNPPFMATYSDMVEDRARGKVVGATDRTGAFVTDTPVKPADVAWTIYDSLGLDPRGEIHTPDGRPVGILDEGRLVTELFG